MRYISSVLLATAALCFVAGTLHADGHSSVPPRFRLTDLGILHGGQDNHAHGINNLGQVVGYTEAYGNLGARSFLWTPASPNAMIGAMVDLGVLGPGPSRSARSIAHAINDYGQVVGQSTLPGSSFHAYLWTPETPNATRGSMTDLGDFPGGADQSVGLDINAIGQVVGEAWPGDRPRAFVWTPSAPNGTNGSMSGLRVTWGQWEHSQAVAINDRRQVVGLNVGDEFPYNPRSALWRPTTLGEHASGLDLGDLPGGFDLSRATDIDNSGRIVGWSGAVSRPHAYIRTPTSLDGTQGTMIDLGSLLDPGEWSEALAINDRGDIVGRRGASSDRALLWALQPDAWSYAVHDLNDLTVNLPASWVLVSAADINDRGQIVGTAEMQVPEFPHVVRRAFLLTPVPEPAAVALLAWCGFALRRQRCPDGASAGVCN